MIVAQPVLFSYLNRCTTSSIWSSFAAIAVIRSIERPASAHRRFLHELSPVSWSQICQRGGRRGCAVRAHVAQTAGVPVCTSGHCGQFGNLR